MSNYSANHKQISLADKCSIPEYDIIYEYTKDLDDPDNPVLVKMYWYNNSFLGINKKGLNHINKLLKLAYVAADAIPGTRNMHTFDFCDRIADVKLRQTFNNFRYKLSMLLMSRQIYESESEDEESDECETTEIKEVVKTNTSNEMVLLQSNLERYESLLEEYKFALVKQSAEITEYKDTMVKLSNEVSAIKEEGFVKTLNATYNILHSLHEIETDQIHMLAYCNSKVIHVYYVEPDIDGEDEPTFDANCEYDFYFKSKPYSQKKYIYVNSLWMLNSEKHLDFIKDKLSKSIEGKHIKYNGTYNMILEAYQEYLIDTFSKFKVKVAETSITGSDIIKRLSDVVKRSDEMLGLSSE